MAPNDHSSLSEVSETKKHPDARTEDVGHRLDGNSVQEDTPHNHWTRYPNRWAWFRCLGVMILIIFGNGVDCQVVLGSNTSVAATPKGDYLSLNFGWACGTALGVWVSGGVSGGHINPAVTLALATFRGFPWKKVPIYIFAQLMGGIFGAAIIYGNYFHAINIVEGGTGVRTVPGTASLFSTYALPYMPNSSAFFDEFLGTAVLLIVVLAVTDAQNGPPPPGLVPLVLFILILGIGAALGMQTGYAINPARDLGPRILTAIVGYGREVFNFRHQYWLWCPVIAPFCGALIGALVYDAVIFQGGESILNKPDARHRRLHQEAHPEQHNKLPAGISGDDVV